MTATLDRSIPAGAVKPQLKDVIKSLPKACFQKSRRRAWQRVALSVGAVLLGYGAIALSPWFLLPFAWFFTGTALTGFFVIGHDCGHRSFARQRWLNDLVGHTLMMPLIYPFHSWRLLHDHHHKTTNQTYIDNAWQPWTEEDYANASPFIQGGYRLFRQGLWWLSSIIHWAGYHFDPKEVAPRHRSQVRFSIAVVIGFAAVFFPTLIWATGWWGLVKFWVMPWLGFHFWLSTFTLVHHTLPEIQFRPVGEWDAYEAQVQGTVHCRYPRWIEILCHDINVHIPHHVSTAIPSYNLAIAHRSLQQHWGHDMIERRFSWQLMQDITRECHLYHPQRAYQRFSEFRRQR
ncbi:fatty acid desaturase [filamentous cyanobacterium CCP5]|nr:fatty acid desaturase [filamentous cyanobacterium CCP5]